MAVSYMTKDGYDKIFAEINYLETVKRPEAPISRSPQTRQYPPK